MSKIKVAIIDDSALVRQIFLSIIESDPELEVVFTANDPVFALEKMKSKQPDVIILDVEMPRMDGISFLRKIMSENPVPVIICSTLTETNSPTFHKAIQYGAIEVLAKPVIGMKDFLQETAGLIKDKIKAASKANLKTIKNYIKYKDEEIPNKTVLQSNLETTDKVIAIGTSTGGTIALEFILSNLDSNLPGIVIVQHMPEKFTASFAERLNKISRLDIREAKDKDRILNGTALIAPGNKHMSVKKTGAKYYVDISDGPLVSRHRPSVDVLFRSVAKNVAQNAVGIIMTGMGDDGSSGLKEMRDAGAFTVAQDEESSVVFGMPKEAIKKNAVDKILSLSEIPSFITRYRIK